MRGENVLDLLLMLLLLLLMFATWEQCVVVVPHDWYTILASI
jgi:hypothetical protein